MAALISNFQGMAGQQEPILMMRERANQQISQSVRKGRNSTILTGPSGLSGDRLSPRPNIGS